MNQTLRSFQGDEHAKEAFKLFMLETINEEALKRMYAKEDVSHIADAVDLLNNCFLKLEEAYGLKRESENVYVNEAK